MGRNRFTPTSLVLVIVLILALVGLGKMVSPPPPGPPEPPPSVGTPVTQTPDPNQSRMKEMMAKREAGMKNAIKQGAPGGHPKVPKTPAFDPNTIEVTPTYFDNNPMGKAGEVQMAEKVAKAKAEEAERRKDQQVSPPAAPAPAPTSPLTPK